MQRLVHELRVESMVTNGKRADRRWILSTQVSGILALMLFYAMPVFGQDRMFYCLVVSNEAAITQFSCDGTLTWSNAVANGNHLVEKSDNLLSNNWVGFLSGTITSVWSSINLFAPTETLVDDFEGGSSPAPWTFANGPEFPGATGSLTLTTGYTGHGMRLAYDFSAGGAYVSAGLTLPQPLSAAAIAFRVRSPAGIHVTLRVVDESGQTLQYRALRPFETPDPPAWCRDVVDLATPDLHWSGMNDGIVHGRISQIYLLAADPLEAGAVGTMDFDDVQVMEQLLVNLDPFQMPVTPAPAGSSNLSSLLGVNIHFTQDDAALDAAHSAGFSWVRMDLLWGVVETSPGVYDFSTYDTLVADLDDRNMKALFILDYGNPLYTASGGSAPPTNAAAIEAFGAFAEAAASHFAGHQACFEVWNEPNIAGFWPPQPSAAQYVALVTTAVARVHAGDPSARVTTAGLSGTDFSFLRSCLAAGGGTGADAIGVHPYRANAPETATDDMLAFRSIISGSVPSNPVTWDTEWGYSSSWFGDGHSSGARLQQAVMVARELLTAWSLGFPLIIYYDIRDDGSVSTNAEHNFGLLSQDYSDKPAMQAVRTLTTAAAGRSFTGFLSVDPSSLYALRLDGTNDMVVALWARAGGATVLVPPDTTAIDILGVPITLQPAGPLCSLFIEGASGPVYLTIPKH